MTREQFARKIRWNQIFWFIGIVNVTAQLPQTWKLVTTHITEGLALEMFLIYLLTQTGFALEGFFRRNRTMVVTLGLSAMVTIANITLFLVYRP